MQEHLEKADKSFGTLIAAVIVIALIVGLFVLVEKL